MPWVTLQVGTGAGTGEQAGSTACGASSVPHLLTQLKETGHLSPRKEEKDEDSSTES